MFITQNIIMNIIIFLSCVVQNNKIYGCSITYNLCIYVYIYIYTNNCNIYSENLYIMEGALQNIKIDIWKYWGLLNYKQFNFVDETK